MNHNRRQFVKKTLAGFAMVSLGPISVSGKVFFTDKWHESKPWLELSKAAYLNNASLISKMANGKPIIAVLKNNAYGIGNVQVANILDKSSDVYGIAVVKDESALAMRSTGVSKPILLMGGFDKNLSQELLDKNIILSVYSKQSLIKIIEISRSATVPIQVALYIDTGLGRMGIPYQQVVKLSEEIDKNPRITIAQTFSTLTTPKEFAKEQILRFEKIISKLDQKGISTGLRHLAPSYSLIDLPNSHQNAVRPGILLHGSFPLAHMSEAKKYPLQVPYRLKAPVIRVEKLNMGDTIGFSRFYKVLRNEWIATLPIGWADGYDSSAENGAKILLGDTLYPVVNVNASHTNISLGENTMVTVGDIATLIGPDRPEITPEGFGKLVEGHNYLQINYKESITKHVYETF
ncbi:alanine racemase [Allomuricauda sp. R78024]|uniref:alanine racemase n=1 Tax=Allomuricauda sp. R78024 TaxID=3093867 RepID=UPI0037C82C46